MSEELSIQRGKHVIRVRPNGRGGWDIVVNGGGAATASEIDQIATFIGDGDEAQRLLGKLRAKL